MSNLKKRVYLLLALIMLGMIVLPVFTSKAASITTTSSACEVSMTVKIGNTIMKNGTTYAVTGGEKITVTSSSAAGIAFVGYYFVENGVKTEVTDINSSNITITVPAGTVGKTKTLYIEAVAKNDDGSENTVTKTGWMKYYLKYNKSKDVTVSANSILLSEEVTTVLPRGQELVIKGLQAVNISNLVYCWDKGTMYESKASTDTIKIPTSFVDGSTHALYVNAKYLDGSTLDAWKVYNIKIGNDIDDELIIEPWMEENDELSVLAVSLRNDSNIEKANKNIYALDEAVTYCVDYKNGGKDIETEVTLSLELPLAFEVVDAFGGNVEDNKITWIFADGMEKGQSGTKVVVIKYVGLSKAKYNSEVITPVADILKGTKIVDSSAVINLIYRDEDTTITEEHEPYMFGDKEAPTFRPNDTITRAEGALVLTRIFGISTSYDGSDYSYPDLNQTYEEARKAIVAATRYGLLNGFNDGKYYPNEEMTRAQFMKVIATQISLKAEETGLRGFEIKDEDNSIKLYKDPTRIYVVNNEKVSKHWAIEEVTLLVRLNMTSVSKDELNLRLDKDITRAEVAQLVNFYLLRAPAKVTSKTTTSFVDVSKSHKLFADIVEATRAEHDYTLTTNGREIAK